MSNNKYCVEINDASIKVKDSKLSVTCKDIKIEYGKFVIMEGDNGSGKSTFLKFLANAESYYKVENCDAKIYGQDIIDLIKGNQLQRKVIYIGQEDRFETRSSVYNALICATKIAIENDKDYHPYRKELKKKLKDITFDYYQKFIHSYINKGKNKHKQLLEHPELDARFMFFKKVSSLSGGQMKMIHILQGFIKQQVLGQKLMLLDEPLNNLDKENKKILVEFIKELRKKDPELTIIIITHCRLFPEINASITMDINSDNQTSIARYEELSSWKSYDCLKK